MMSVPRLMPPSTMICARPRTAATTSGRTSIAAAPVVELAPAMVGDIDGVDAMLAGERRILGRGDALEDERQHACP